MQVALIGAAGHRFSTSTVNKREEKPAFLFIAAQLVHER